MPTSFSGIPAPFPVGDEVYGYPPAWPAAFEPDPEALAALLERCRKVRDDFTDEWNAALEALAPQAAPSTDAFTEHADLVLLNYPGAVARPDADSTCSAARLPGFGGAEAAAPAGHRAGGCDADPGDHRWST